MSVRLAARRFLGEALRRTLYATSARLAPRQPRVLLYHSIDDSGSTLSVSAARLRQQLEFLKGEGWRTLSAAGYAERLGRAPSGQRECLLTFDDGYENFYEVAAPIFLELGLTATVFIPTDFIGDFPGWFERDRAAIHRFLGAFQFTDGELRSLNFMIHAAAGHRLMSRAQITELSHAGFDFQSHSAAHHFLPSLSREELDLDLARSRRVLSEELGSQPHILCYPYGAYNQRIAAAAQRHGYQSAVLAEYVGPSEDNFELGRVPVSEELGESYLRFAMSPALERHTRWMGRRKARGLLQPI